MKHFEKVIFILLIITVFVLNVLADETFDKGLCVHLKNNQMTYEARATQQKTPELKNRFEYLADRYKRQYIECLNVPKDKVYKSSRKVK